MKSSENDDFICHTYDFIGNTHCIKQDGSGSVLEFGLMSSEQALLRMFSHKSKEGILFETCRINKGNESNDKDDLTFLDICKDSMVANKSKGYHGLHCILPKGTNS